ncbi:MAG TPA: substrate-binding domain-containing protein [Candidatus Scatomonas pullistercoris]|uniref:Substrate-binding domain-containing protein n=1 Tax=Candidatus Scatomonas pullistercoris TaxID=2840920 RepID=A0A9D1P2I1_9FIRM|nr:substrate-binding domain-containing protein [Candidatus Scatomonas pullistercoris]
MKKKIIATLLAATMALSLTACGSGGDSSSSSNGSSTTQSSSGGTDSTSVSSGSGEATGNVESPVAGKKIAYIMLMSPATIFQMWSDSFTETAEKLGMTADTFFCADNAEQWQTRIEQCAAAGYDGLMVSHGGQEYAWDFLSGILEQYPDLKIVTFDTPFKDANGETAKIEGVTQFFQRDAGFAADLLEYLMSLPENAEKVAAGEPLNILQVQQGAGYNSPFDRRQEGYQPYEDEGKIVTVERIAPTDDQNATQSMRDVMTATLAKYSDDEIDGIWCCYDAYAQGVYQALSEQGRDIPMVSVDISNEDIQFMQEEGSQWKACATTNWTLNGEFACRILALELANQYEDIAAASCYYEDIGAWLEIPSSIITQEQVTSQDGITIENVGEVADESYSDTSWMPTCDWMVELLGR